MLKMDMAPIRTETRFTGVPISRGQAIARVCMYNQNRHADLPLYHVSDEGVKGEQDRLRQAIAVAAEQLDGLVEKLRLQIGPAEAQVFEAHKAILTDQALIHEVVRRIQTQRVNAETALIQTLDTYQSRLLQVENEYIRDRVADIGEVQRRLLDVLADRSPHLHCSDQASCRQGRDRIVVAEELTPTLTVGLQAEQVRGFVTERGGATSHAAILARGLGIPAVSGIKDIYRILDCGTELLLNGDTGEVILWPGDETLAQYRLERDVSPTQLTVVPPVPGLALMANISRVSDVAMAVEHQAEGIGLYRTEMEFFAAGRILTEEEQYERYAAVQLAMNGKPVCFRLLDIGGDKGAAFFALPCEDNPALGLRGSRLLLARGDLLSPQARALVRASSLGPVDILYPMIVDREQFLELKAAFQKATADLPSGKVRHGVMFEVPSACLQARELLDVADFGSIGTNDLLQFLYAADRNSPAVAEDGRFDQPVVWSLLAQIAAAARETGRTVSICGEAASQARFLPALTKLGLTTLSVNPRLIPGLRLAAARQDS